MAGDCRDKRLLSELYTSAGNMKDDAYAATEIVCVPSAHETFGLVYLEAYAFGKPVVGLRIPTIVEIIEGVRRRSADGRHTRGRC